MHLLVLENSHYIPLSDAGQHSTRMRCHFCSQQNCVLDYFNNSAPDGKVIYAGDTPLQYAEKEGIYTKVLDNMTGNILLATSRDQEFRLSYRNTVLHTSTEFKRSSHNYSGNPSSSTTTHSGYHLQNPVTHYIQHNMKEKEMLSQKTSEIGISSYWFNAQGKIKNCLSNQQQKLGLKCSPI